MIGSKRVTADSVVGSSEEKMTKVICCKSLEESAERGHVECFREFMRRCKDDDERRSMINATHGRDREILLFYAKGSVKMIREIMGMVDANGDRLISFETVIKRDGKWKGATTLHRIAMECDVECFRAMLEMCKDDDERRQLFSRVCSLDGTILHSACSHSKNGAMIKEVLNWEMRLMGRKEEDSSLPPRSNNKSSLIFALDKNERTPLFWCESAETVDALMDAYGDDETRLKMIMMKSRFGSTVLNQDPVSASAASAIFKWAERLEPLYQSNVMMKSTIDNAVNALPRSLREYLLFSKDLFGKHACRSDGNLDVFLSKCVDHKEKIELLRNGCEGGQLAFYMLDSDTLKLIISHFPSKSNLCNLFCAPDNNGTPPLHHYILNTDAFRDNISYILDQFADRPDLMNRIMNMQDKKGRMVLHAVVLHEKRLFVERYDIIKTMLFTTDSSVGGQIRKPRPGVDPNGGTGERW